MNLPLTLLKFFEIPNVSFFYVKNSSQEVLLRFIPKYCLIMFYMFFSTLNSFVNFRKVSLADRNGFILSNEKRFNAGKGRHNLTITAKKKNEKEYMHQSQSFSIYKVKVVRESNFCWLSAKIAFHEAPY